MFWMLFDPYNEELKMELNNIENLCHQSREKEPSQDAEVCKIEFDPLSLTKSDANFVIGNPGVSTDSLMESTSDIVSKQHKNQIESQMDLYKSNPAISYNQFEPLDMMLNGKERAYVVEKQSVMDFDVDSIKSDPTLMSMSHMEDTNTAKPTKSMTHCATNMPETIGITFKISRETTNRRLLSFPKLSKVAYGKLKQGNKIEFYDHNFMTEMIVSVHNTESPSREVSPMLEDEQVIGEHTINVPQFTAELQDGQLKRKHSMAKKPQPRKLKSTVPYPLHLATLNTSYVTKYFDPNSVVWCREDSRNGNRFKQWVRTTQNNIDKNMITQATCNKRKSEILTLEENFFSKKRVQVIVIMSRAILCIILGLVRIIDMWCRRKSFYRSTLLYLLCDVLYNCITLLTKKKIIY